MSVWMIVFVGVQYAAIAAFEARRGNLWMAQVFLGYAFSNIGLAVLAWKGVAA